MKKTLLSLITLLLVLTVSSVKSQDLMDVFGEDSLSTNYTSATFKTTRVVSSHSIENPADGVLLFMITHHFGRINSGAYDLWGLDQATIRLGFEYGINNFLSVGIGRSTYQKTYDGFVKARVLRQSSGVRNIPVTVSLFSAIDLFSIKWTDPERENYFSSRISYVHQVLIARKFNENLSIQLTPSFVHKNLAINTNTNDHFALGMGGRYKITRRTSFNVEYFYNITDNLPEYSVNPLSVGFDIETGGHVFQLHLTNSQPMFDRAYITETQGKWSNGDIYFGFNISRVFTLKKPKEFK